MDLVATIICRELGSRARGQAIGEARSLPRSWRIGLCVRRGRTALWDTAPSLDGSTARRDVVDAIDATTAWEPARRPRGAPRGGPRALALTSCSVEALLMCSRGGET